MRGRREMEMETAKKKKKTCERDTQRSERKRDRYGQRWRVCAQSEGRGKTTVSHILQTEA